MCMLTVFAWRCSYDCIRQCISFRSMSVWNSGLLVLLEWFLYIQCNSRWYNSMQSLHVALSITRFLEFTATGTGSGWQSDWIQQYFICNFWCNGLDTIPFEVDFLDKLIHTAWSMYSCNVTARGGMKVYGYTRCAVTMFGLECMLHFTLEFVSK